MKIAVFCGSSRHCDPRFLEPARQLGAEISLRGHVLVYGGGRSGLMGAVADTALAQKGRVEGVIPRNFMGEGAHHLALDELQVVDDMRARKAAISPRSSKILLTNASSQGPPFAPTVTGSSVASTPRPWAWPSGGLPAAAGHPTHTHYLSYGCGTLRGAAWGHLPRPTAAADGWLLSCWN